MTIASLKGVKRNVFCDLWRTGRWLWLRRDAIAISVQLRLTSDKSTDRSHLLETFLGHHQKASLRTQKDIFDDPFDNSELHL